MIFYDFFSGCGGTSQGMREAGLTIKLGIDCDRDSAKTYRKNFPAARFRRDIRLLKVKDIEPHVSSSARRRPIVFGACAPCQPFSKQRRGNRRDDIRKDLLREFHRFVRTYLPECVFIENVPGLQAVDDQAGPFAQFLKLLMGEWSRTHRPPLSRHDA
jgi:DNA (cytosine-5)-methyltransferase 1